MTPRAVRHALRRPLPALAFAALLALGAAACGDDDDDTSTASASGGGDDHSDMTVEITSPSDGDEVEAPFDVTLDSNVEIGETDTGLHHFHLHYDGDAEDYDIVYEDSFTVERDLGEGEHTVQAVLANADHSETDVTDEITVTVGSGGSGGGGGGDTETTEDPYGY
jgi:hypothetical protein